MLAQHHPKQLEPMHDVQHCQAFTCTQHGKLTCATSNQHDDNADFAV